MDFFVKGDVKTDLTYITWVLDLRYEDSNEILKFLFLFFPQSSSSVELLWSSQVFILPSRYTSIGKTVHTR